MINIKQFIACMVLAAPASLCAQDCDAGLGFKLYVNNRLINQDSLEGKAIVTKFTCYAKKKMAKEPETGIYYYGSSLYYGAKTACGGIDSLVISITAGKERMLIIILDPPEGENHVDFDRLDFKAGHFIAPHLENDYSRPKKKTMNAYLTRLN